MLDIPYSVEELCDITVDLVERNGHREDIYIRPLAYKSAEMVANLKLQDLSSDFTLITVPFGSYLGSDVLRCCTSSWRRTDDTMIPTRIKSSGSYVNSILAKTEATLAGFDEAIILNQDGHVCEGSGENIFIVTGGRLVTPVLEGNALPGITRDTVIQLAQSDLGLEVVERSVDRSELYLAEGGVPYRHCGPPDPGSAARQSVDRRWQSRPNLYQAAKDVLRNCGGQKPEILALVHRGRAAFGRGLIDDSDLSCRRHTFSCGSWSVLMEWKYSPKHQP